VLGFDMTSVLEDTLVASVIYEYLFNRIESMMDGSRMRIVVAEGWRALQDESFKEKIRDWSSTPRKKNAFLIMDTQSPSDIAQSDLACKVIQETVTQVYFANPTAEYNDYVGQFKLSEKEYQIIKSLNKSSRFFLLKQGKNSVVVRADLREGFENEITILSGRESNVRKLDMIRAKKGDDPNNWMTDFFTEINHSGVVV
jgi:type IV secretion system protein VirB4